MQRGAADMDRYNPSSRAIGLAILTYGLGIFILQLLGIPFKFGTPPIGQLQVALGGAIFGLGIGISGTCIFSSEWRAGGGSIYSMIVLTSTILLGMPTLAFHYGWWLTNTSTRVKTNKPLQLWTNIRI